MKILWIKAGGVVPADTGGKIRSLHILRELARRHAVTLFTFYPQHAEDRHGGLKEFQEVIAIPLALPSRRTLRDYVDYARLFFSPHPYSMQKYYAYPEIRRRLNAVIAGGSFDALICDFIHPAGMIDWTAPVPKILFTHNVEAQIWKRQSEVAANPVWKLVYEREARALAQAERRYLELADYVLTVSEPDRAFFAQYVSPDRIAAIPTGVDVDYFRPACGEQAGNSIVFTGSMDWMPNEDSMSFFTAEIFPKIVAEIPDARLWIVGRRPSRTVLALAGERVQVTGDVEDIRPYVNRAPVYIVPLRCGSGTRIKIFEAMAMGKAVVSTSIGAEGLPVSHGRNILIADDPGEFAGSVMRVLRDRELAERLGRAARELVETEFSWGAVGAVFEGILQKAVWGRPPLPGKEEAG